jgi:ABC-2 type transport system permease protein
MTATEAAPRRADRSGAPDGGAVRAALASETTKLRSVRSTVWTLVVAVVAVVGIGAIITAARVSRWNDLPLRERLSLDPTTVSLRGVFLAQLAIGVLGVLVISSEYTTGMIRTTFAAVPRRPLVLFAKAVTFTVVAFVVSTVACFVAFFIGQSILSAKHANVSITDPGVLRAVLGAGTYLTLVGLLGIGLGTLLRRTAGAIATLFGLVLVLPALTEALPSPWDTDVGKLLPINAGRALFAVRPSTDLLSPGQGFLVLLATVGVVLVLATAAIVRRDA